MSDLDANTFRLGLDGAPSDPRRLPVSLICLPLDDEDDLDAHMVLFRVVSDVRFVEPDGGALDLMFLPVSYKWSESSPSKALDQSESAGRG